MKGLTERERELEGRERGGESSSSVVHINGSDFVKYMYSVIYYMYISIKSESALYHVHRNSRDRKL